MSRLCILSFERFAGASLTRNGDVVSVHIERKILQCMGVTDG
jgi:hypothetical protein